MIVLVGIVMFAIGILIGLIAGVIACYVIEEQKINELQEKGRAIKFQEYYKILLQWLALKHDSVSLSNYFIDNNYNKIAIYGMGEIGNRLVAELNNSGIDVVYAIDQSGNAAYSDIIVYTLEDELPFADVIIVTTTFIFRDIKKKLEKKTDIPIVSLNDVVFGS